MWKFLHGLGLCGSPGAPILIYMTPDLMPLCISTGSLSALSASLNKSAPLDGCGRFHLFLHIMFHCRPRLRAR